MPPRIPILKCLRAPTAPSSCTTTSRPFSSTSNAQASTVTQQRKHRDPYAIAQAKARKAANISRQEVLKQQRASTLGNPVRGVTTPFVQSFDTALPPESTPQPASSNGGPAGSGDVSQADSTDRLNFYLNKDELARGLKRSQWLSNPLPSEEPSNITSMEGGQEGEQDTVKSKDDEMLSSLQDLLSSPQRGKANADSEWSSQSDMLADITTDTTPEARKARLEAENANAEEALRRIASLSLGSSKDRLRVNKQRCIAVFGRHNTDQVLPPKSAPAVANGNELEKLPRVGVDTGSSEVQIAILTAKIRAVADFLETRGTQDKVNKRNLRLLVHRRAKLLKYLRRKERGGPRWQNLVEKLGLVEGTWKGEITM